MRNILYLLLAALTVLSLTLPASTNAFNQLAIGQQQADDPPVLAVPAVPVGLPNYDIRQDTLAAQSGRVARLGVAVGATDLSKRERAIEALRNQFAYGVRDRLRVIMNEAGVPKMLFNTAAPLAPAQSGTPDEIARDFLASHPDLFGLSQAQVAGLKVINKDDDRGTTFLNYEQTIDGISVFEGQVQVAVRSGGEVISVGEGMLIPEIEIDTVPALTESEALQQAFIHAGREAPASFEMIEGRSAKGDRAFYRNPLGEDRDNILSEMRMMRVGDQALVAWQSYIDIGPNEWYQITVDANTGELLFRYNLYADTAQGMVYRVNGFGQRTMESFVGDTLIDTPAGWMDTSTVTTGNNVDAYLDSDANNQPDPVDGVDLQIGHAFSPIQDFTFPFIDGVDPRTQRAASVTNLFYLNNMVHDFAYRLGFTESAGNFQVNNFDRGGIGNDPVRAEAQDGSGTNNANFGTPVDGSRPRMQMFFFTRGTTGFDDDRDGSFDADVVLHEYGHGISNRLVGGPANVSCLGGTQAGAMGEGWSDYWSITYYNDGRVGEYVTNNLVRGIRRAAYSVPAAAVHDSYADLGTGGFEVHRDGEIWTATLWDLRQTVGALAADRLILQGMKFTPCRPSFLNARDGILVADQNLNNIAGQCTIWRVFARHGMGVSAVGNNGTTHVAATDIPAYCTGGGISQ